MTMIRTTCPRCGEVDMPPGAISVELANPNDPADRPHYRFTCPSCYESIEKLADRTILSLLASAGVPVAEAAKDVGPTIAGKRVGMGPMISFDDAIDFHESLKSDESIEDFLRQEATADPRGINRGEKKKQERGQRKDAEQ